MHLGKYVFSQIAEFIPRYEFDLCVQRYHGHYRVKSFSCYDQLLTMMFGQLTRLGSLRGIVVALQAHANKNYHLGFRSAIYLSTLAKANENRDWRIYRDLAQILIKETRTLYMDDHDFEIDLEGSLYILDSTIIELSLGLFKWAKFEFTKSALKDYPEKLRRIKFYDAITKKRYVYLTNNFELEAETVAELYRNRWQVELFFKWIKQHLEIQIFFGRSKNAVKTQICIAFCTFLVIAIMKRKLKIDRNIHEILQILQVSQFIKEPINTLLSEFDLQKLKPDLPRQASLLDF